ncbi:hypothetical protein HPT27_17070 [Permianibacter sp. IMCC34836]|uniref:hypothetical protein n=1 Tax=Permianibacter fluminis TaxID=2738515 RepID=UPI0015561CCC|nr:hypothetical protein [Permianibacter fluminis]
MTAVHVLDTDLLPVFEKHQARIEPVLGYNSRELCGWPANHNCDLFPQLENIENRIAKVRRPQSNGFVERLHRTLLNELFRIQGRASGMNRSKTCNAI